MTARPTTRRPRDVSTDRVRPSRRDHPPNTKPPEASATTELDRWFDDALPRIYGYFITRVGGDVHDAEDLTQETMLAAVDSRGVPSANEPMAWLFGIARHKLLDHYRRQHRLRLHLDAISERALADLPDDRLLPELDPNRIQTRDTIVATLQHLPPRQRSAFVLRYLDGLDVPATADMLGVSIHAAESLLARGRRTFRQRYQNATEDIP